VELAGDMGPRAQGPDVGHSLGRHAELVRKPGAQARIVRSKELLLKYKDHCRLIQGAADRSCFEVGVRSEPYSSCQGYLSTVEIRGKARILW
jgi:hypothetical protein